jgi:hypothetical protein
LFRHWVAQRSFTNRLQCEFTAKTLFVEVHGFTAIAVESQIRINVCHVDFLIVNDLFEIDNAKMQ